MGFLEEASRVTRRYRCTGGVAARRGFVEALRKGHQARGLGVIGEFKRCAPGRFIALHDPWWYAQRLAPYVDAFSVLTEPFWFCGSPELIPVFSPHRPVLGKDFVECESQVDLLASHGAAAVLLILDELGWKKLETLYEYARSLGLDALIETSSGRDAVEAASSYPDAAVGINARNLQTLELSFERLLDELRYAAERVPGSTILVAESSMDSVEKVVEAMKAGAKAVLIGTWFMKEPDAAARLHSALLGAKQGMQHNT